MSKRERKGGRREGVMGLFYEALNSIPDSAGYLGLAVVRVGLVTEQKFARFQNEPMPICPSTGRLEWSFYMSNCLWNFTQPQPICLTFWITEDTDDRDRPTAALVSFRFHGKSLTSSNIAAFAELARSCQPRFTVPGEGKVARVPFHVYLWPQRRVHAT